MKIFDHVGGKFSIGLLVLGNIVDLIFFKILGQHNRFLKVAVVKKFFLELSYFLLLSFHATVDVSFHPLEERIYLVNIFQHDWLSSI